jgi:hypothetical protein
MTIISRYGFKKALNKRGKALIRFFQKIVEIGTSPQFYKVSKVFEILL